MAVVQNPSTSPVRHLCITAGSGITRHGCVHRLLHWHWPITQAWHCSSFMRPMPGGNTQDNRNLRPGVRIYTTCTGNWPSSTLRSNDVVPTDSGGGIDPRWCLLKTFSKFDFRLHDGSIAPSSHLAPCAPCCLGGPVEVACIFWMRVVYGSLYRETEMHWYSSITVSYHAVMRIPVLVHDVGYMA
jgi:hypothetical protein